MYARESVLDPDSVTVVVDIACTGSTLIVSVTVVVVGAAIAASCGKVLGPVGFIVLPNTVDSPSVVEVVDEVVPFVVPFENCLASSPPR